MCNNTKQKIAAALRQLMNERPFEKITVQNLMDATNMKRQSFYYHFQDTRDVLMWICRQELLDPLAQSDLEFVDWLMFALRLLDKDRAFYRKLLNAAYLDFVLEFDRKILNPRLAALLYPRIPIQSLNENQKFVVDFAAQAAANRMIQFVHARGALDLAVTREQVLYLLDSFKISHL